METTVDEMSDEIEEEEFLVYADFDAVIDESKIQKDSLFKVIGLDEDEPFLQIGTQMYSGKWHDAVGTNLFFESEPAPPPSDPVFSEALQTHLNYKFKTRKCLELSRVFVNSKTKENDGLSLLEGDESSGNPVSQTEKSNDLKPTDEMEVKEESHSVSTEELTCQEDTSTKGQ